MHPVSESGFITKQTGMKLIVYLPLLHGTSYSTDLDSSWKAFCDHFMLLMHSYIPSKPSHVSSSLLWVKFTIKNQIKAHHSFFAQTNKLNCPTLFQAYCSMRNKITACSPQSKQSFFFKLSTSPKSFWSYVRSIRKKSAPVPPLSSNGLIVSS